MLEFLADGTNQEMALRLFVALLVGGCIGLERSHHGRSAGFRTHAIVCLSTALLALMSVSPRWFPEVLEGRLALDPTRLAQGIMTGIGFLGAGTIMKDGLSVRGLTTAASIWITAAIGIHIGTGLYFPALIATALTIGTLSVFRFVENRLPVQFDAELRVRFPRDSALPEDQLRQLLQSHGFDVSRVNYVLDADAHWFEYRMAISASRAERARHLSDALNALPHIRGFQITPTSD